LLGQDTFNVILQEEYLHIIHTIIGKRATQWIKADCFTPVVSLPLVWLISTVLAVHHKHTVKQFDCKNAFVQSTLPGGEVMIIQPPCDCPLSSPNTFWHLKKSLYGLKGTPWHWYQMISKILESPWIGLQWCKNDPCFLVGNSLPDGHPPLYLALYMDDFIYFTPDPMVEQYFESAPKAKLQVEFMGTADCFLGSKFEWSFEKDGHVSCRLSQESYGNKIVDLMGQMHATVNPCMTPY